MKRIFGTDGIRGRANSYPMTAEMALQVGKAAAELFKEKGRRGKIVIGKDTRLSGYMFETALTAGILSCGVDAYLVGPMPTPAVAHLTKSMNADVGIMISASHNPAEDNGLKLFSRDGTKLSDDFEEEIEKRMMLKADSAPRPIGKAYRVDDAIGRYIEYAKSTIRSRSLNGTKVVIDCANGAAYRVAPTIFSELGAEVIALNVKPNGLNINLGCGALHIQQLKEAVLKEKADVGVAFDGDADRVIFVDEKGNEVDGDKIMAILAIDMKKAKKLEKDTVVATVMSNAGFESSLKKEGITVIRTPVGDRYVAEVLKDKHYSLGGEQSGHIIISEYSTTGDGIIVALHMLAIMTKERKPLSELGSFVQLYPQTLINVKVRERKDFSRMKNVEKAVKDAEKKLKGNGRVLLRYSGTEHVARVMVEGKIKQEIDKIASDIADTIKEEVG